MSDALLSKLRLKPGMTGWAVGAPANLAHLLAPTEPAADPNVILAFALKVADVTDRAAQVLPRYRRGATLWFAYPKKSGTIRSDISRDQGWAALTALDLLPVTQVAIDQTWSALRFRYRDEIAKLTRKY